MKKIKIIQQVLDPNGIGGVSSEYKALIKSDLVHEFDFIPVVLKKVHSGISIRDIAFYYKSFKKGKADIIQIRGAGIDGLNAIIAARLYHKSKVLLCVHGMYSDMVYYSRIKRFFAKHLVEPLSFRLVDGISCVYKQCENRTNFKRFKKKCVQYVYNRMPNYDSYDIYNNRARFRDEYGIDRNKTIGIFCGRISREKGIEFLLEALKEMSHNWPDNFMFVFVGDGDYFDVLKHEVSKNNVLSKKIVFTGVLSDVKAALAAADFFVMPSLHENHSIALLEAMAMHLPTICTKVGGNEEIVTDDCLGITVEAYSVTELNNAIKTMLNSEYRSYIKQNILKYDFAVFSDSSVNNQLKAAYYEVIGVQQHA